jgi:ADP-heptose:LPS heptosyltransferase
VCAVPALRGIRRSFPDHEVALAAPRALARLARASGAVDRVLHARPLAPLPAWVRESEVGVNLHGSGPESHRVLLAAAPRRLVGFAHPEVPESAGGPRWRVEEHEVARWCRMLAEHGIPADPDDLDLPPPARPAPRRARGATLIHPGAASPARCWPAARWAAVARAEVARGHDVVLSGGSSERPLCAQIAERARLPDGAVAAAATDVVGLAALVAAAGRVVCGDTGVAHLATALRVPSVVLFGPTPPARWGPPPDRPWHRALWAGREGDPHGGRTDPGLLEIGPGEVIAALEELPAAAA